MLSLSLVDHGGLSRGQRTGGHKVCDEDVERAQVRRFTGNEFEESLLLLGGQRRELVLLQASAHLKSELLLSQN